MALRSKDEIRFDRGRSEFRRADKIRRATRDDNAMLYENRIASIKIMR